MPAQFNTAALELLTRAAKQYVDYKESIFCENDILINWTDEDWQCLNTAIWMAEQTLEKEGYCDQAND